MTTVACFFVFIFGSIIGSFLNMLAWRLPEQKSLGGRSVCVRCGHVLSWQDLLPLLSFLFLRGRCRYCKKTFSPRYFFTEVSAGFLFVAAFLVTNPSSAAGWYELAVWLFIVSALILIFVIDMERYQILDSVVFYSALTVLAARLVQALVFTHSFSFLPGIFIAVCAGTVPLYGVWYFSRGTWMGFGDVKAMVFIGVSLGTVYLVMASFFIAVFLGTLSGLLLMLIGKKQLHSRVPFGTFLSLGTAVSLFFGPSLIGWYLKVLGF